MSAHPCVAVLKVMEKASLSTGDLSRSASLFASGGGLSDSDASHGGSSEHAYDTFDTGNDYEIVEHLGAGSYGVVYSARAISGACGCPGLMVAIKRVPSVFRENLLLAKRTLREICILRRLHHVNLVSILDLYRDQGQRCYLVMQLMDTDLDQVIRSDQPLKKAHITFFVFSILRAVAYLHSRNIIHRDLKPANVLVNEDCSIRVADLGMARTSSDDGSCMTEYVTSRWWRAPEIVLSNQYGFGVDVWSVGTILAELILRKPLFAGRDYADQLLKILGVLGTPDADTLQAIADEGAQQFVASLRKYTRVPWSSMMKNVTDQQQQCLDAMLTFDPRQRPSAAQVLQLPMFEHLRSKQPEGKLIVEEANSDPLDPGWNDEQLKTTDDVQKILDAEIEDAFKVRKERIAGSEVFAEKH